MPQKRRGGGRPEMLSRNGEISSLRASMRVSAVERRGEEPDIETHPWLDVHGTLSEPVRDVRDILISMYPEDKLVVGTARPAAVGSIIRMRPEMSVVLTWPQADFDLVWAMAMGGQLKFAYLYFTRPHYCHSLVVSVSFSNVPEE